MPDPDDISDALLDKILAAPPARDILTKAMADAGISEPLDELPRETQRALVAALVAATRGEAIDDDNGGATEAPDIPDTLVARVFADPEADGLLRTVMADNDLDGEPADLDFELQRAIVEALVARGFIRLSED